MLQHKDQWSDIIQSNAIPQDQKTTDKDSEDPNNFEWDNSGDAVLIQVADES